MIVTAIIPARANSKRIKNKNILEIKGHPLLAYTVCAARESGVFDEIYVTTDCNDTYNIGIHYGADDCLLRPSEYCLDDTPNILWLKYMLGLYGGCDIFAILRPTNPFRTAETIRRGYETFKKRNTLTAGIRAVHMWNPWNDNGHPGKMYTIKDRILNPLHEGMIELHGYQVKYQDSPTQYIPQLASPHIYDAGRIYMQNGSMEMYVDSCINTYNTRLVAPFETYHYESLDLNTIHDWNDMLWLVENNVVSLPKIDKEPYVKPEPMPWEVDENY